MGDIRGNIKGKLRGRCVRGREGIEDRGGEVEGAVCEGGEVMRDRN